MRHLQRRTTLLALILCLQLASVACQKHVVAHPNQLNTLDGQAYDDLYTAQAALKEAAVHFKDGSLPQSAKPVYTAAAAAYNNCQAAWKTYRAVLGGTQTGDLSAVSQKLQDQLITMNASIAALKQLGR